jgi:hypothetical protein
LPLRKLETQVLTAGVFVCRGQVRAYVLGLVRRGVLSLGPHAPADREPTEADLAGVLHPEYVP